MATMPRQKSNGQGGHAPAASSSDHEGRLILRGGGGHGRGLKLPVTLLVESAVLDTLKGSGTRQCYKKGQIIFYEGHRPLGFYVHESGCVAFLRGKREVRQCAKPCLIGIQTLLVEESLPCSARAEENVSLVFVGRTAFRLLKESSPALYDKIQSAIQDSP